jgi:hypothetical protein
MASQFCVTATFLYNVWKNLHIRTQQTDSCESVHSTCEATSQHLLDLAFTYLESSLIRT